MGVRLSQLAIVEQASSAVRGDITIGARAAWFFDGVFMRGKGGGGDMVLLPAAGLA